MSTIDDRIVRLAFDNSQFEKNASTSIHTLDKLKESLNFTGAIKGLSDIEAGTKSINMGALANSVQTVADKFNYLGVVAFTVIQDMTRDVLNFSKKITSALTIDPIKMGFQEYETQINSVQTILANTQDKLKAQGLNDQQRLDLVNQKLDELNLYADKTIYNFTQMTRNIGTFTAAGVELETATKAIQGIANLAAVSGSTSQQASTAMYQLSQALAAGRVKLMDWNSVVNAGMGGEVFQKELKDTARAHGIAVDQIIEENGSFRDSLQDGWITSEILTETLEKFTATTEGLTEAEIEQQRAMWRSRGYTEEQIDAIFELGEMSTNAATKVKTFSQLIDTTKEALQSGWTQSWEYIIGDFEEAKELWTSISDVLNDYIGKSADARNSVLKDWNESEGGRKAVLEGLGNAFNALVQVLGTVNEAFREVFPSITAQQLIDISTKFRDFTKSLMLTDEQLEKLKGVATLAFRGIRFGIEGFVNIAQTAYGILKSIGGAFAEVSGDSMSIFATLLTAIGSRFKDLTEAIKPSQEQLDKLKNFFVGLFSVVNEFVWIFGELGLALWDGFGKIIAEIMPSSESFYDVLSSLGDVLSDASEKLFDFFHVNEDTSIFEAGIGAVTERITEFLQSVKEFLNLDQIVQNFRDFLSSLRSDSGGESDFGFLTALHDILQSIKDALSYLAPIIKEKIDMIREALANFAQGAGDELGKFNGLDFIGALGLGVGGGLFFKFAKSLNDIGDSAKDAVSGIFDNLTAMKDALIDTFGAIQENLNADSIKSIATAIAILAGALFVISLIDTTKLLTSIGVISLLMYEVKLMLEEVSAINSRGRVMKKAGTVMIEMAAAIFIMSLALKKIGEMSTEDIMKGLLAVTILAAEMTGIAVMLGKAGGKMTKGAFGLIGLAAAVAVLAIPVKVLGGMDLKSLAKGVGSVAVMLFSLAAAAALIGQTKFGVSDGLGLIAMAGAIMMLAGPVERLSRLSLKELAKGLGSVVLMLAAVATAANFMPKNMISIGMGMIAIAAGIKIMAESVEKLGSLDLGTLIKGLGSIAVMLGLLAIAANAMVGALPGAAAMLVMSLALIPMASALALLSSIPFLSLVTSLGAIAAALAIFGAAAYLLTPVAPILFAIGAAFALFGVGAALFAVSLMAISAAISAGGMMIILFIRELIALLPFLGTMVGEFLIAVVTSIGNGATAIATALMQIIEAVLLMISTEVPNIIQTLLDLLMTLLTMLLEYVPQMAEVGLQIILGFLQAIADNIQQIVEAGMSIVIGFMDGVSEKMPELIDSAFKLIISFIDGLAQAIDENHNDLYDAVGNLIQSIVDALADLVTEYIVPAGADLVRGFIDGMLSLPGELWNAACSLATDAWNAITGTLDEHSPSRLTFGGGANFTQGFINGLLSLKSSAASEASGVAMAAMSAFDAAIDPDYHPTITPIMNLSEIQNGVGDMSEMLETIPNMYGIDSGLDTKNSLQMQMMGLLSSPTDYSSILNEMAQLRMDLQKYSEIMANTKLIMDTGTLVGELTPGIDRNLGRNVMLAGRRV